MLVQLSRPMIRLPPSQYASYATSFPASQTPVSEGGNWIMPVPSQFNTGMNSIAGVGAYGDAASSGFNDSVATLVGTHYGPTQVFSAVVSIKGAYGAAEVELHARTTFDSSNLYLYEFDIIPAATRIDLVRWNGIQGDVTFMATGTLGVVADGDLFTASVTTVGADVALTIAHKGVTIVSFTDIAPNARYLGGNPGMGGDIGGSGSANIGWKSYSVVTSA